METRLTINILPQPDDNSCGPTCLHAIYDYYGDRMPLDRVIGEARKLEGGGTLAVYLGNHALARGYAAALYTFDLQVFDPTWFEDGADLAERLETQMKAKDDPKLQTASRAYLEFLGRGGKIHYRELTLDVFRRLIRRGVPVLCGLSATYLYGTPRELTVDDHLEYDDIQGAPAGHFVVVCGYKTGERRVIVADPLDPNPLGESHIYEVRMVRLIPAVMLGTLTFDANLLIITRPKKA